MRSRILAEACCSPRYYAGARSSRLAAVRVLRDAAVERFGEYLRVPRELADTYFADQGEVLGLLATAAQGRAPNVSSDRAFWVLQMVAVDPGRGSLECASQAAEEEAQRMWQKRTLELTQTLWRSVEHWYRKCS